MLQKGASKDYDFSSELAIRQWARNDKGAAQVVKSVDARRVAYIKSLLMALGHDESAAVTRAMMLYALNLSQGTVMRRESKGERMARLRDSLDLILAI